jgi:hypothetical protein
VKISTLIDVAIRAERNVTQKEAEKIKYESFCVEVQREWKMRCVIRPIITAVVTDGLQINSEATPGKHSVDSLQKTAELETAHTHTHSAERAAV